MSDVELLQHKTRRRHNRIGCNAHLWQFVFIIIIRHSRLISFRLKFKRKYCNYHYKYTFIMLILLLPVLILYSCVVVNLPVISTISRVFGQLFTTNVRLIINPVNYPFNTIIYYIRLIILCILGYLYEFLNDYYFITAN